MSQVNEWPLDSRTPIHLTPLPVTIVPSYEVLNRALGEFDNDRTEPTVVGDSAIPICSEYRMPDFAFSKFCNLTDAHFGPPQKWVLIRAVECY